MRSRLHPLEAHMFLSEDVQKAKSFGEFISTKAKWDLTTSEAIILNKHFVFYNQIVQKIEDHVLELQKTYEKKEDTPAKKAK
jgi:hypothetical protein